MKEIKRVRIWPVIGDALIATLVGMIVSLLVQILTMESININVSPSVKLEDNYVTVVGVYNLKQKTLPQLSLYIDDDIEIFEIQTDDGFRKDKQYVQIDKIAPKEQYSLIIQTDEPIFKDTVVVESDYKVYVEWSDNKTPRLIRKIEMIVLYGSIMFLASFIELLLAKKRFAILEDGREKLKESLEKSEKAIEKLEKDAKEIKAYDLVCVSDLKKELSFWKDTVRKLLYGSGKEKQSVEKVMDTVTSMLQTYSTRENINMNFDEIMYLAEKISQNKEKE